MSGYLEEAAQLVRKVADQNERDNALYSTKLNTGRLKCVQAFALLAAIDRGLLPQEMAENVYGQFAQAGDRS